MIRQVVISLAVFLMMPFALSGSPREFTELYVSGPCGVSLVCSPDSAGIVIARDGSSAGSVDVRRTDDALYVSVSPEATVTGLVELKIYTAPSLRIICAEGRATISGGGVRSGGQLSLVASGASSLMMTDVSAGNINVSLSGSGKVSLGGEISAETVNMSLTGSGRINVDGLAATLLTLTQRGSGKIFVSGSARKCSVVSTGTGRSDVSKLVSADMHLKLFGNGRIYYPAGVRVSTDGKISNIISIKPYQPL